MFKRVALLVLSISVSGIYGQNIDSSRVRNKLSSAGAVTRTQAAKNADTINVKDFGAVCDGVTDDLVAIQAAVDAVGSGTLNLPFTPCAVSSPGIFLYPANNGITVAGATGPAGFGSAGGGLIALAANPPAVLLTLFAQNVILKNILLDGNSLATTGVVSAMGLGSIWNQVTTRHFLGDGAQVFNEGTPVTSITAGGGSGSSLVTVSFVTNNRLTFGAAGVCTFVVFDYGLTNPEQIAISSVVGRVLHLASPTTNIHTTARCHGNANEMHIDHYSAFGNGGWGFHVVNGSDNNAIYFVDGSSSGNSLGGELWSGSRQVHVGGNYEGDFGPAVQLGAVSTGETTHFSVFNPLGDVEESNSAFNVISLVCDDSSTVIAVSEADVSFKTGGAACSTYASSGTTTGVFGTFIGGYGSGFWSRNSGGYIEHQPGPAGVIKFYDYTHSLIGTLNGVAASISTVTTSTAFTSKGTFVSYTGPNFVTDTTGGGCANNAICATITDAAGSTAWFQGNGLTVKVLIDNYTLQAGANTLTLNGVTKSIVSHKNFASNIATGYPLHSVVELTLAAGNWQDMSQ